MVCVKREKLERHKREGRKGMVEEDKYSSLVITIPAGYKECSNISGLS
jgi:hypothetical protein